MEMMMMMMTMMMMGVETKHLRSGLSPPDTPGPAASVR